MSEPSSEGSRAPISIAVVGAGGWGKNHVRNFASLSGSELRYVCDRSDAILEATSRAYPGVRCVESTDVLLEDESLRAVVVATDAPSHHVVALEALEAGKDVLVEKPLALEPEHAMALCKAAERGGRILMVGHLLLYHAAIRALRDLIRSGELGEILYVYSQRVNLGVVRQDENAWWSLAPHDISVANYLLEAEPIEASASGGVFLQRERGIEDVVFATLGYPGGRLAHIHVSWLDPHKVRRLTVVGDKKMAVFDDTSPDSKLAVYDKGVEPPPALSWDQGVRVRTGEIRMPALRMQEPLRLECESFLHCVRTRERPVADGRSGLSVVRALAAGHRSLESGGAKIHIGGRHDGS